MGSKNSRGEPDSITWVPVPLTLGQIGLDLRRPGDPGVLTELLNAKFQDEKTIARREGHIGRLIQGYTEFRTAKRTTNRWVYGHGTVIQVLANLNFENSKHPIHKRGGGTFEFGDSDIVWTGDRMFIVSADGPFYGSNDHWNRNV